MVDVSALKLYNNIGFVKKRKKCSVLYTFGGRI